MNLMNTKIKSLIQSLYDNIKKEDFIDFAEDIVGELKDLDENAVQAIAPILQLFENYPDIDYGMPGPLVHFLESFYKNGYENKLIESIKRKPTLHTLWMLNRIINSVNEEEKLNYISILKSVAESPKVDASVQAEARHYLDLQQ